MRSISRIRTSSAAPADQRRPATLKFLVCKDLPLQLNRSLSSVDRQRIVKATSGLPALTGSPLFISALPKLSAHHGKLLSSNLNLGTPVHAASFIRRREIVLETELLAKPDLPLIFVHELFHFVWVRLGNAQRSGYVALLTEELRSRARGEVGESATVRKQLAAASRDYVCESFCDTAAWLYAPVPPDFGHVTLAARWQQRRRAWFDANLPAPLRC